MPSIVETTVLTLPPIPSSLSSVKTLSLPLSPSSTMTPNVQEPSEPSGGAPEAPHPAPRRSLSPPPKDEFLQLLYLPHDEEELFQTWRLWTKTKGVLANGNRLENASWRRWYQKKHNIRPLMPEALLSAPLPTLTLPPLDKGSSPSKARVTQILQQDLNLGRSHSADERLGAEPPFPALKPLKKKKKQVRFDESRNQTAFVSYVEEQWEATQPEMIINVDELSKVRHARLKVSHLLSSEPDLRKVIQAKETLMFPAGFDPCSYAAEVAPSSPPPARKPQEAPPGSVAAPNPLAFLQELDDDDGVIAGIIEVIFELFLLFRWCAGLLFLQPPRISW